ncbi:hypothetical protein BKA67DRAFT_213078 [Truncatella angustata]|uniref:AAA+ ATPase domain-containing protein n=1 Tax=Truncatella angustata TaxID=152316 RepID=A0A9P9A1I9_9PEZI|nr:uncharacterized protein BKA67DRAFT_213078 [Truncatella angustata]KAH6658383.1 hypothetical protein BKA67DRAFT_213078 [Truncatella angustata]
MKIQDGSLDKISFDEMYYLYSPGDLIIDRESDVDALYQVYAVTGGRMRLLKYVNNNVYRPPGEEEEADNSPEAGIGTWTDVVIDCFRLGWDGKKIGPRRITHRVPHYTGEKKITDLNYYPVRFRRNSEDIIKKLKLRGRAALECYGHKKYAARTTKHPSVREPLPLRKRMRSPPPRMSSGRAENAQLMGTAEKELESDVYVDIETFNEAFPFYETDFDHLGRVRPSLREVTESTPGGRDREYHIGDHDVDEARSDGFLSSHFHLTHAKRPEELADMEDYLMLLPHCVPAFDFRQREWYWLDVEKLEEIDKSEDARRRGWEDLVIEDGYSQLLLSLVDNHTSAFEHKKAKNSTTQSSQIDLIKGKGRGLILLLHGPPGTGKTSTAETIAAYTGKPLYAVTCGDIGVTAREVEDNLREHTERAEKWGCVLLLDEADVFLAKRTWTDMNRNAVVSVFLRHLEYYSGILFLTTNIVGIIDEAFKSRIHVALRYDMIDQSSTERIWNNILDRIIKDNETSDVKIKFDRDLLLEFALSHYEKHEEEETTWNARQIRNAFSTAIAMGQFDRFERIRKEGLSPDQAAASGTKSLMTIRLTKRNFAKIAETATDFERYINAVRGPDADNALASQQRDDYFARQLAPPRRKNRRGSADFGQGPRRRGYLTPQSSKPVKGKKVAERSVSPDDDQENSEQKTTRANKPRIRREEFSEDDEDGISDE